MKSLGVLAIFAVQIHVETTFGCQYFGEYGPDDLATCILTMIDIMCCGCISGYDQCEA